MTSGVGRALELEKAQPKEKPENAPSVNEPAVEQIRLRAHQIWLLRGNQDGSDVDDWLRAEEEIRREMENRETVI